MSKGRIAQPAGVRGRPPKIEGEKTWAVAPTSMPPKPEAMTSTARREWARLEPFLKALDRVAQVDMWPLATYCMEWSRFSEIMATHLGDHKAKLYEDGRNCEVIHPLLAPLLRSAKDVLRIAALFGMTARSRDLESDSPARVNSAIKRLFGNRRKVAESKIPDSIIPILPEWTEADMAPPLWMNQRAVAEYERLGSELVNIDLFCPLDAVPVAVAAGLYDLQQRAYEQLKETDLYTYVTKWDPEAEEETEVMRKEHPLQKGISDITTVAKLYWADYGLSPRNRRIFANEEKGQTGARPLIFTGTFGKRA